MKKPTPRRPKLTLKMEAFARKYVMTGNASEAYRRVYKPKKMSVRSVVVEASRLLSRPNIALTVEALRHSLNEKHAVSLESLSKELDEARTLALAIDQPAASVQATMGKAKLHGHLVDRKIIIGKITLEQLVAGTFEDEAEEPESGV